MMRVGLICGFILLLGTYLAAAQEANDEESNWDWLGTPVLSYGDHWPYIGSYYYPYFDYRLPASSRSPIYTDPFWNFVPSYYSKPYWTYPYAEEYVPKYLAKPWWIGSHTDLPKVLDIARSGSSVRVYSSGLWQAP